ncbi:hypothetical protein [Kitasatospora sp. P5_F3]
MKLNAGAPRGVIASQDGRLVSKFVLWHEAPVNTWRFGLSKTDTNGWSVDQVIPAAHAQLGTWTRVIHTSDYPSDTPGALEASTPYPSASTARTR